VVIIALLLLLLLLAAALAPLWINSERIGKTTIRPSDMQAVAERWASEAGWSVTAWSRSATSPCRSSRAEVL
jgi:hypothetical protein